MASTRDAIGRDLSRVRTALSREPRPLRPTMQRGTRGIFSGYGEKFARSGSCAAAATQGYTLDKPNFSMR